MELPVTGPPTSGRRANSYTIEAKNLSYTCQSSYDPLQWLFSWRANPKFSSRVVVENASLEAKPGEITAIAGPSGAGKTTLLEILAGRIPLGQVGGQVLVNGCPVDGTLMFRRLSGYVTQDDALFPMLTVEETLMYRALLRLPGGKRTACRRVKMLMHDLGLDHLAGSRVGEGSSRGISGGERRRLSIGVELVHDPPVLLIDEPTSGLDSASALHIVSMLKMMVVSQGKTVILSIHQPGFRILELFDKLVLLSNGRVLHNGSLQLLENELLCRGHHIPSHVNVLEFAIEVANTIGSEVKQFDIVNRAKFFNSTSNEETTSSYTNSYVKEVQILGDRFCKNIFRTKELFATKVVQAILVGSILGTVYMKLSDNHGQIALQTRLGFFAFTLSFLLSSTTEGLPIFLQERHIFTRETSRGSYRVSSYVTANTLVFLPFLLLTSLLYSTPAYWLVGLRRDLDGFLYFALVVWLVVLMSNAFTACCSALVPNFIMGSSAIAGLMGGFFLFSGYFIARENIPKYWLFMHYVSLFKYPFESLIVNEYGGKGKDKCLEKSRDECVVYGDDYLRQLGLNDTLKWTNLSVMLGFILGYRVLCYCILWYRSCRINK